MLGVIGSLAIIVFAVYLLGIITDSFFIISLDQISQRLDLSEDVAGASLMAVGSSAPELAIALIALFTGGGSHSDVGIGTIVGSAVFNILVITGVSAVVAKELRIQLFAVRRDVIYYLVSIAYLAVIFLDGEVILIEAIVGLVAYAAYVAFLAFYKPASLKQKRDEPANQADASASTMTPSVSGEAPAAVQEMQQQRKAYGDRVKEAAETNLLRRSEHIIVSLIKKITGAPSENYVWTFFVAIVFIIILSYILVEATIVFAAGVGIPPVLVALTLLAAGTSAPDLIASIEVAREGRGGMAVANAIGSDIFDVLIGLGFPWFIAIVFQGVPSIHVGADDLWISIAMLVGTTLVLWFFLERKRNLSRNEGIILLLLYVAFVIFTILTGAGA